MKNQTIRQLMERCRTHQELEDLNKLSLGAYNLTYKQAKKRISSIKGLRSPDEPT